MVKSLVALLLIFGAPCMVASDKKQTATSRPTVLVTASTEIDSATSAAGAATNVGGVVVGAAGANTSTYQHSEVWEVVRRFTEE
jgi:hypothetical protein